MELGFKPRSSGPRTLCSQSFQYIISLWLYEYKYSLHYSFILPQDLLCLDRPEIRLLKSRVKKSMIRVECLTLSSEAQFNLRGACCGSRNDASIHPSNLTAELFAIQCPCPWEVRLLCRSQFWISLFRPQNISLILSKTDSTYHLSYCKSLDLCLILCLQGNATVFSLCNHWETCPQPKTTSSPRKTQTWPAWQWALPSSIQLQVRFEMSLWEVSQCRRSPTLRVRLFPWGYTQLSLQNSPMCV